MDEKFFLEAMTAVGLKTVIVDETTTFGGPGGAGTNEVLGEPIQYLILHKVRGEAAFDIAHQIQIGDEKAWIVSTSGHRAYPAMQWRLDDLADTSDINGYGYNPKPWAYDNLDLSALPDHYQAQPAPASKSSTGRRAIDFLRKVGVLRQQPQETDRRA